ncbi:Transcriptional regulator prz1 [Colletotrichum fructicola]|nr:Transcriptional regulator prz1 [Colletotrichum fructicola]
MAPASSSLSIPNVLSSEYDPFSEYDPAPYGSETYPPPPSQPSSVVNQPHTLADVTGRSPAPSSPRSSFSYPHGGGHPTGPRIKMENTNDYGSGIDVSHYPSPRSMQVPYMTEPSQYVSPHQAYLSDTSSPAWSKTELDAEHYYQHQTPLGDSSASGSHHGSKRAEIKPNRPKRSARRMTTVADANYQCEVKGCGKLFSRSYNYKAHLETHDEKREYPFPCPVADCNKKFVRKTDLQRHNQSVHMKERNHKCDYCGRLFARKDTLRRHMEDGCSKRFDVGTCDLRIDGYEGMSVNRNMGGSMHPMGLGQGTLPPITMPIGNNGGLLHPVASSSRGRSVISGTSDAHSDHWPR